MKLVVFGATGGTGRQIVEQALAQGHTVTAFVRRTRPDWAQRDHLVQVQGDVLDLPRVQAAVQGQQAVLNALGTRLNAPRNVCSAGTKHIIAAMQQHGVRRLIVETAYGAGERRNRNVYTRLLRIVLRSLMDDKDVQEEDIRRSGLEWVIVRPPRLTNGPRRGVYEAGPDVEIGLWSKVSRADVADFMLKQVSEDRFLRQAVGIRY